ncbi:MAG: hypothetical protein NVSMB54_31480 [Ktedonobacteraceae bacterium]
MVWIRPWKVSDELWEQMRLLILPRSPHPKGGRLAIDDRQMFAAIMYVLRTGIQWNALLSELGVSSTIYDCFRTGEAQGFFQRLWQSGLEHYDKLVGIVRDWQSVDSSTVLNITYDHEPIYGELYVRGYEPRIRLNLHHYKWHPLREHCQPLGTQQNTTTMGRRRFVLLAQLLASSLSPLAKAW